MRVFKKIFTVASILILVGTLFIVPAHAAPILDLGVIAPTTGSISYLGGANPLEGTNIQVDNVVGLGTLINDGVAFNIVGGRLDFKTGNPTGQPWDFGGGASSTISVIGGVDINGDGDLNDVGDIANTTLLSGVFGHASVSISNTVAGTQFNIAGAGFSDTKNDDLLDLFGLPKGVPYEGAFNISFTSSVVSPGSPFTSTTVLSGDIVNTPVPEPTSMLLLGSGLAGVFFYGRKKISKAKF
ncbi:PEP-CTERM sorting domain-containing protein [Desulforhabdus sp. TSK]|uniref:PEP-CTERM sorting domain-containing protein n=1 Tax=Desulforhabdus sp. TSK TaxID=2925014 RepID=UPI001FC860B3|nr:PEP-CTERM sorting domain-containing protein [Desulforhabdus sp. TSK]GKT07879.1 hypothetical protein DSTSK_11840 [Desulforhabdus sp. TSK]